MEGDVLGEIGDRLRDRAAVVAEQLIDAAESGEASPSAVLGGIKELRLLLAQLENDREKGPVEIVVRMEDDRADMS